MRPTLRLVTQGYARIIISTRARKKKKNCSLIKYIETKIMNHRIDYDRSSRHQYNFNNSSNRLIFNFSSIQRFFLFVLSSFRETIDRRGASKGSNNAGISIETRSQPPYREVLFIISSRGISRDDLREKSMPYPHTFVGHEEGGGSLFRPLYSQRAFLPVHLLSPGKECYLSIMFCVCKGWIPCNLKWLKIRIDLSLSLIIIFK